MKDLPITMMPDGWMEKTGGYAKDMTLRDHFAALAMQAMESSGLPKSVLAIEVARAAYEMADAMLEVGNAAQ